VARALRWDFSTCVVAKIQRTKGRPNPGAPSLLQFVGVARYATVRPRRARPSLPFTPPCRQRNEAY